MRIKDVCEQTGIKEANVRFYEKEGLVTPTRKENGYREYTEEEIKLIEQIKVLRLLDIPISTIKEVMNDEVSLRDILSKRIEEIDESVTRLKEIRMSCENIVASDMKVADLNDDVLVGEKKLWTRKLEQIVKEDVDTKFIGKGMLFMAVFAVLFKLAIWVEFSPTGMFYGSSTTWAVLIGVFCMICGIVYTIMEGLLNLDFLYVWGRDWGGSGLGGLTNSYSIMGIGVGLAGVTWPLFGGLFVMAIILQAVIRMALMHIVKDAERKGKNVKIAVSMIAVVGIAIAIFVACVRYALFS